ncbi:MAG TPA: O-antigen ligase family protein [Verrucomicrobiae bacterium]|jgi:O-antigen ligase|nr:O-antigen ligase family protein [Verrucomicrobiae bacterium]
MQQVALILTLGFIAWLLVRDHRSTEGVSKTLWVPTLWVLILGSRPISMWFNPGQDYVSIDDISEGNALNRNVFLVLEILGVMILTKRGFSWGTLFRKNKWLMLFFIYFAVSAVWSDAPFVSFKRWIKDFGNVVMVMVVLTEENQTLAIRKLFVRTAYILMPLSVLFIKYYADIGRYYNPMTWQYSYGGVTRDKNELGGSLIVFTVFLVWNYFAVRDGEEREDKRYPLIFALLLLTSFWLLHEARSSTSLVCTIMGIILFLMMRNPGLRLMVARYAIFLCAGTLLLVWLEVNFKFGTVILSMLGRDATFTGRTEIWDRVLQIKINPLIGVGFYSFWMGSRVDFVSDGFFFHLTEAHNGYLETYVDGGLIGLALLIVLLFTCFRRLSKKAIEGGSVDDIRLIFIVINIIYNITEAHFGRQSVIWMAFLLVAIDYPTYNTPLYEYADEELENESTEETFEAEPSNPAF